MTVLTGHYGSGKSEVSIHLAIAKKIKYILDMDVVNPYFRSREAEEILKDQNIRVISSGMQSALGSDLPYISKEVNFIFASNKDQAIVDLGGSQVGALLLRQAKAVAEEELDLLFCVNVFRPETSSVEKIVKTIREIEESGGRKVTGLINNSNQLRETTVEDVLKGQDVCLKVSKETSLPIVYTTVLEHLAKGPYVGEVLSMKLFLRREWL